MNAAPEIAIVYQARNLVNGRRYIGFTCQGLTVREKQHRYDARKGKPNVVKGRFPPMRGLTFRYLSEQPK